MIHSLPARAVTYAETDRAFLLTWESLCHRLQEAALAHAEVVGWGAQRCRRDGVAWVLHRLAIEIRHWPALGAAVQVDTWSTGIVGLRGRRDFRLHADNVEAVRASSVWVHFDLAERAPRRVPEELARAFAPQPGMPIVPWVDVLDRLAPVAPDVVAAVAVRYTDLDSNDHVNNAAYADIAQTLAHRGGHTAPPQALGFVFVREVSSAVTELNAAFAYEGAGCARFALSTVAGVHATGMVRWAEEAVRAATPATAP
jgi:medium-chain acyl-[acyl-carrier-protein] hydrolase